jgi:uncharacterized membrane protein
MHPFSLREALQAKHAQHVVLIHFPIALFMAGVAFDFAAQFTKRAILTTVAYYNFTVAAISTIPVIATGLLAWQFQLEGQRPKGILLQHLVLGMASGGMIYITWYLHFRIGSQARSSLSQQTNQRSQPFYRLPVELLGVAMIAITAHLGGYLSGVNGAG